MVVDSSLDWGQDAKTLAQWANDESPENLYVSFFGSNASPKYYGLEPKFLPNSWSNFQTYDSMEPKLVGGTYVISATMLQQVVTRTPGKWNVHYEKVYQAIKRKPSDELTAQEMTKLQHLRFGRLCAYLRHREPDDHIGYSLLVYELSDEQVNEALHGEPAELFSEITVYPHAAIDRTILKWYGLEHYRN